MKPLIVEEARRKFGRDLVIRTVGELALEGEDEERNNILVVGTLRKHHVMEPSLLEEQELELNVDFEPRHTDYIHEEESLSLEDQTASLELAGWCLEPGELVSDLVVGCWGSWGEGEFWVEELLYSRVYGGTTPGEGDKVREDVSVSVISGLELAGQDAGWLGSAGLAAAWLAGSAGGPGEQRELANTERLVLAGNSLGRSDTIYEEPERDKYRALPSTDRALAGIRQLDDLLLEVVATLTTDLMAGPSDPVSPLLPQQPLAKGSLRLSSQFPSLRTVTNPYTFRLADRIITTVAGQAIKDIMRNTRIKNPLVAMEKCLLWGHLAPITPSTLTSSQSQESDTDTGMDPLVLLTMPDIFIAGNQPDYQARKTHIHGHPVLLVAVPRFSQTESLVRINLRTLRARLVRFNADLDSVNG